MLAAAGFKAGDKIASISYAGYKTTDAHTTHLKLFIANGNDTEFGTIAFTDDDAMTLASKCKFFTTAGGKTREAIQKSEEILEIKFSKQCNQFYERFGYLSFYGYKIFGIDPDDTSKILEL